MCLRTKNLKIFIICAYLFFIYFIKKNSLLTGLKFLNCLRIIIDIHLVCPADLSAYERSLWPTAARTVATFTPFWDEKWFGCHFVAYYDISEKTSHFKLTNTEALRCLSLTIGKYLHEYRHAVQFSPARIKCQWSISLYVGRDALSVVFC